MLGTECAGSTGGLDNNGYEGCKGLVLADTCNIAGAEAGGGGWESVAGTLV